ncbi:MAG: TatD family hydrolase [Bacteroidetes bacterium]|nr:TatD family hydrolase [Bacteroidota bacterium]
MILADSHTHLYLEQFNSDRDEMIRRAVDAGVLHMYLPNIDRDSIDPMLDLAGKYPGHCHPMMGLHPTSVKANYLQELETVSHWLDQGGFCAVGEIGIDLYWSKEFITQQEEAFRRQIRLAHQHDLPIVIHTRNSFPEVMKVVQEEMQPGLKGVFHCFSGNLKQALQITEWGFYLGIGGVLTFRKSGLEAVVKEIALEHLILETDAPFLAPEPYRGKRNESAYIPLIAHKMAEIKGTSIEEIATVTTRNTLTLFKTITR